MNEAGIPEHLTSETDDLEQVERESASSRGSFFRIEPRARPAGSPAEARTARDVLHAFQGAHAPATELPVFIPVIGNYSELCCIPLLLIGILLALLLPLLGALVIVATLSLYTLELAGAGLIARVTIRRPGFSVLAAIPAPKRELRTLIITTPLDTAPRGRIDRGRLAWLGRRVPLAIAILALVALAAAGWRWVGSDTWSGRLMLLPASALAIVLALVGERSWAGAEPAESSTDALEAMATFAATIRAQPARWVDVWMLATGGGSISGEALRQFISANTLASDTTFFVNLQPSDGICCALALAEGPLWTRKSAPALVRMLTASDGRRPLRRIPQVTQAAVAIRLGYQVVTIFGPEASPCADESFETVQLLTSALKIVDREMIERNRMATLARATDHRQSQALRPPQT